MSKQKKVTPYQVMQWMGGDHLNVDELVSLLCELANGEYDQRIFRQDVERYNEVGEML